MNIRVPPPFLQASTLYEIRSGTGLHRAYKQSNLTLNWLHNNPLTYVSGDPV